MKISILLCCVKLFWNRNLNGLTLRQAFGDYNLQGPVLPHTIGGLKNFEAHVLCQAIG